MQSKVNMLKNCHEKEPDIASVFEPVVSVIIPVYNVSPWLRECLDSVINQTWNKLEIILVDDGSTDNSDAICDEYAANDTRIRVIHQANAGQSAARNAGLCLATGKYVWFIDSDDYLELYAAEILINKAEAEQSEVLLFTFKRFGENISARNYPFKQTYETQDGIALLTKIFENSNVIVGTQFEFIRLDFLRRNNLRFIRGIVGEDFMMLVDFMPLAKSVCVLNEFLYNYRVRDDSTCTSRDVARIRHMCESYYFIFHELYSKYRREILSRYIFEQFCLTRLFAYASRAKICEYEKHEEIRRFLVDNGLISDLRNIIDQKRNIIFYGAGELANTVLKNYPGIRPSAIYDMNADNIREIGGISVTKPDFTEAQSENNLILICISNRSVIIDVKNKFGNLPNVTTIAEYLMWC